MALLAAALNPAFVHQGVTILAYLPSGNPLTLESLLYGLAAGAMLGAVALWFVCVTDVITSDKVVYLFGRVIPALSLLLSMILRFVPRFVRRLRAVAQAQRHLGRDTQTGAPARRVRSALRVFSIVVTWSLESGLITADSMRCRGYGLPGRTSFSLYRFDRRDGAVALWLAFCGLYLLGGGLAGGLRFQYYPMLLSGPVTPLTVSFFAVYGLLCFTPVPCPGAAISSGKEGLPMPELLRLEHFGFTYPQQPCPALADVSLTVRQGEFWVLCGASGCGKTTLLRQLKPALSPHGAAEGCILFEEQTVTDKVWH